MKVLWLLIISPALACAGPSVVCGDGNWVKDFAEKDGNFVTEIEGRCVIKGTADGSLASLYRGYRDKLFDGMVQMNSSLEEAPELIQSPNQSAKVDITYSDSGDTSDEKFRALVKMAVSKDSFVYSSCSKEVQFRGVFSKLLKKLDTEISVHTGPTTDSFVVVLKTKAVIRKTFYTPRGVVKSQAIKKFNAKLADLGALAAKRLSSQK